MRVLSIQISHGPCEHAYTNKRWHGEAGVLYKVDTRSTQTRAYVVRVDDTHLLLVVLELELLERAHVDGRHVQARVGAVLDERIGKVLERLVRRLVPEELRELLRVLLWRRVPLLVDPERHAGVLCLKEEVEVGVVGWQLVLRLGHRHVSVGVHGTGAAEVRERTAQRTCRSEPRGGSRHCLC